MLQLIIISRFLGVLSDLLSLFMHGASFLDMKVRYYVELGNIYHHLKKLPKSIICYEKALRLAPADFYAHAGIAAALLDEGASRKALDHCLAAIAKKNNEVFLYVLLTIIYKSLGELSLSDEAFEKTLELYHCDLDSAYDRLSYTCYQLGQYDEAARYCKENIRKSPNKPSLHYNLGKIFMAANLLDDAKKEFRIAQQLTKEWRYRLILRKSIRMIEKRQAAT